MKVESQRPKERKGAISELNTAIETLNLARDTSGIAQAKALFGTVSIILATIRVTFLPVLGRPWERIHNVAPAVGEEERSLKVRTPP